MATIQKKISRGHTYWQIVESRRINGKPRPIVLAHLGTATGLLKRLQEGPGKPLKAKVIQFGGPAALWNIAAELKVVETIDRFVPKRDQGLSCGQYMLLAAVNRCLSPTSKASLYDWYRKTILHRLLPAPKKALSSQRFWDHMDLVTEKSIAAIETEWANHLVQQFKIDLRTLIFDATNFDTFIDTQNPCTLPQRGHAKSKRSDLRIIGLALLVSIDHNMPLFSHVYPGNQNDATTFSQVTDSLVARYRQFAKECQDITLVFDGGNNSIDNLQKIDKSGYHFISSLTLTSHMDLLKVPLKEFKSFIDDRLQGTIAYRTTKEIWGKDRTVVITRSANLLEGQLSGIQQALKKKRAALHELRAKLRRSQKPTAKGKGYTQQSLQKHLDTLTSGQYISSILKTQIIKTANGGLDFTFETDFHAFDELKQDRLGKRILCTDNDTWSTEEIILGSRAQSHAEDAFKQMKDPHWISFSPNFHWTDQKLRVHAFYCVLALTLSAMLRRKAAQSGINLTTNALLEQLTDISEVINLYSPEGKIGRGNLRAEYVLSEKSPLQEKLCAVFDVNKLRHR